MTFFWEQFHSRYLSHQWLEKYSSKISLKSPRQRWVNIKEYMYYWLTAIWHGMMSSNCKTTAQDYKLRHSPTLTKHELPWLKTDFLISGLGSIHELNLNTKPEPIGNISPISIQLLILQVKNKTYNRNYIFLYTGIPKAIDQLYSGII